MQAKPTLKEAKLKGVRVWLSGSLPEEAHSTDLERREILSFVKLFARSVFQLGGHILHGSHPSFTPALLEEAEAYRANGGNKDALTLAVSRFWSKDRQKVPVDEWQKTCIVYETGEVGGPSPIESSLVRLREWLVASSDVIVVVGGRWWQEVAGRAGIPLEVELATQKGIPCFLLGGLGGAANAYIEQHPEILVALRNGLDEDVNKSLATEREIGTLASQVCEQLGRLPLIRGRKSDGISFRVLALDGGGIRGAFTAAVLATWEENTGLRVVDHFDLVAGTSTGAILAIGLGLGLTASQMVRFYRERGPTIFPITSVTSRFSYCLRHLIKPKFSQDTLLSEIQSAYYGTGSSKQLKESKCRLVIPAYHAIAGCSHVFRTPHNDLLQADADADCAHVALASSAAPTYFSAARVGNMISESSFFDGGVWANSPAMAAIVEASCFLNIPLDRLDVLSIGTTDEPFTVRKKTRSGILRWGKKLLDLLMTAQAESSLTLTKSLVGSPRFLRVNVTTPPRAYKLDDPTAIEELIALGNLKSSESDLLGQIRSRFLNGVHVAPWRQPPNGPS